MKRPRLSITAPAEHQITFPSLLPSIESTLNGTISSSDISLPCQCKVTLVRNGRLKNGEAADIATIATNAILDELGLGGPLHRIKSEPVKFQPSEQLTQCIIDLTKPRVGHTSGTTAFQLAIPSYLPATVKIPSVEISYTLFASCTLPDGSVIETQKDLQLTRKQNSPISLQPSRVVHYPESTITMKVNFDTSRLESDKYIPMELLLSSLNLPRTKTMHATDTRWMVPREIRWTIEETAVIISGAPDETGHIPMSSSSRKIRRRDVQSGKVKLKLHYPFTRKGNSPVTMMNDNSMKIPFGINLSSNVALGDTTALSVAGGHVLHTVQSTRASQSEDRQTRFAVYLEYTLHLWVRIGEDVFKEKCGTLVNRKLDEVAYTLVCPLKVANEGTGLVLDVPSMDIPPAYTRADTESLPQYEPMD